MQASASLKPTAAIGCVTVVNIVLGTAFASVSLMWWEWWYPSIPTYVCLGLVGLGTTFAVVQYCATFRRNPLATQFAMGLVVPMGVLVSGGLLFSFTVYELSNGQAARLTFETRRWILWGLVGSFYLWGLVAIWCNWRWKKQLQAASPLNAGMNRFSVSLVEIMGICILAGIVIAPASYLARTNPSLYLENVSATDAPFYAPDTAQAITYHRDRREFVTASFSIDEASLRRWLALRSPKALDLKEITEPTQVGLPQRPTSPPGGTSHKMSDGFHVSWIKNDRTFRVIYDRTRELAIYQEVPVFE